MREIVVNRSVWDKGAMRKKVKFGIDGNPKEDSLTVQPLPGDKAVVAGLELGELVDAETTFPWRCLMLRVENENEPDIRFSLPFETQENLESFYAELGKLVAAAKVVRP